MSEKISVLERYPEYRIDIGIEIHVQLKTKSKIFCPCSNDQVDQANVNICQICSGYPGVLPVLNKEVVNNAIKTGLATNCTIAKKSAFARKHYFYPDLPKNYQITQDKNPICTEGYVIIKKEDGTDKKIRIIRIHIEEDAGKNIHATSGESFVDLNRTGTPLLEVVTYPDIESVHEAKAYLKTMRSIVMYIGASTGNMEEGSFRADTNISVRKKDDPNLGTRCELKNINSFKFISDAIEYETERQIEILEDGGKVKQQTRLWNTKEKISKPMRSKEEAADYRFFQDPDLPIVEVNEEWISRVKASLPELPDAKLKRLCDINGLTEYEAGILIDERNLCDYYEKAYEHTKSKNLINWVLRDVVTCIRENKNCAATCTVTPAKLAEIVEMIDAGKINVRGAQEVFAEVSKSGGEPTDIVKEKGLEQIGDIVELETIVKDIIDANPDNVAAYKSGKDKLFGFFVGQAMQKTKGKADPKVINELLKKALS